MSYIHSLKLFSLFLMAQTGIAFADFEGSSEIPDTTSNSQRPWDASIRLFVGHDNNVALVTDISSYAGKQESNYMGATISGSYRFYQTDDWTAGVFANVDRVVYNESKRTGDNDSPDEYNLTNLNPGLFIRKAFKVNETPIELEASYDYKEESLAISDLGSTAHRIAFTSRGQLNNNLELNATLSTTDINSKVVFPSPDLNSRDGRLNALSLGAIYSWDAGLRKVIFAYTRTDNNTDGSNFDYDGNKFKLRFETHVTGPVWLGLQMSQDKRDYDGFVSGFIPAPGRTSQDIDSYSAQLLWAIDDHWIADAYYTDTDYDSNQAEFKADRQQFGLGLSYYF